MIGAMTLVAVFLVAYAIKLGVLGREDRSSWGALSLTILYAHEACIATMIVAGTAAVARARRFGDAARLVVAPVEGRTRDRRFHRAAGRIAAIASVLALITAAGVLAGMYLRAVS